MRFKVLFEWTFIPHPKIIEPRVEIALASKSRLLENETFKDNFKDCAQYLKIIQNVAFKFSDLGLCFNFGIFNQFLSY